MGTVTDILEAVVDCCVEQSVKNGVGSDALDVIGSIIATVGAQNPQLVAGL
jgi:hypothetical protein